MNIPTKTGSGTVCGKKYTIAITEFANKDFIIISHNGKIGTMVEISFEQNAMKTADVINSKTLLGIDMPEAHALAQSILIKLERKKPVVFGFSDKEFNAELANDMTKLVSAILNKEMT